MIEVLMTATILSIGILGLTMLQVMSLRASRGSRSLSTAVQVGEAVMDHIEMEGRLTWLNLTDSITVNASVATKYIAAPAPAPVLVYPVMNYFDINGEATAGPRSLVPTTYFTTSTNRANGVAAVPNNGQIQDFTVTVTFVDAIDATNADIVRTVTLTRRILHG